MRKNWRNNKKSTAHNQRSTTGLWIVIAILLLSACNRNEQHAEHDTYTCPMHPTVISDKQGTCPVCGMDLVRTAREGEEVKITEDLARLIKSPNETVVSSISTIKGEFKSRDVSVEAKGVITYDTRYVYSIPAKIGGRLEKVYLKYVFQNVKAGQKVAEIYSPELLTAQRELLYLIENDAGNVDLIESAKDRLYLLGATKSQVDDVIKNKEATYTFSIFSSHTGYAIREDQQAPAIVTTSTGDPSAMSGGMGASIRSTNSAASINTESAELIKAGNYISTGQTLFKIVNTSALRIELDLPISDAGVILVDDEVDLNLGDARKGKTKVDFVQPFFTDGEEFVKVRVYVGGNNLRIGQLVNAKIKRNAVEALWLPRDAVLDLGLEKIVFVKEREIFKPKKIVTGISSNGWIEIKSGVSSSDEIASNAQYLVDSESFIKSK